MPQAEQVKAIVKRPPGKSPRVSTLPIEKKAGGGWFSPRHGAFLDIPEPTLGKTVLKGVRSIGTSGISYFSGVISSIRNSSRTPEQRAAEVTAELFGPTGLYPTAVPRERPEA